MSLCPSKILLSTVLVLCTHMKSNFIADSVLDLLCHLFPFLGSSWQTGTDSLCESSSDDFQKTGTMLTTLEHVFLFTFVANSFKSIILCQHTTFLIFFIKPKTLHGPTYLGMSLLQVLDYCGSGSWLVGPFKGLMILENFLWKAPSDAFCNFATF